MLFVLDDVDVGSGGPQIGRIKVQSAAIHGLPGQDPQADTVLPQSLCDPVGSLIGLAATGMDNQQNGSGRWACIRHCGPSATARRHRGVEVLAGQGVIGLRPQSQEVLDVARRSGQWTGHRCHGVPAEFGRPACDPEHRPRLEAAGR